MTRSRIEYGLLAIPTSMLNLFPKRSCDLLIYFDGSKILREKTFVISEKNREARVYGLSEWYNKNKFKEGDEIVIQLLNEREHIYRFISEREFVEFNNRVQSKFDESINEKSAETNLSILSNWNMMNLDQTAIRELFRLSNEEIHERKQMLRKNVKSKEIVPPQLRITLNRIYKGICQVCQFWFLKKDNSPYFEIHHINASLGNHPKNLLVVCANCHRQFEFAYLKKEYDSVGWFDEVKFNQNKFAVHQAMRELDSKDFIKTVYI
jgi:RNase P subunit RPR2